MADSFCQLVASAVHTILLTGRDLYIGPDSDGILNLPTGSGAPSQQQASQQALDALPVDTVMLPASMQGIERVLDAVKAPVDMPEAEVPDGIIVPPKRHQLQVGHETVLGTDALAICTC